MSSPAEAATKRTTILPGKNVNLFFSLCYLSIFSIIPLAFLVLSIADISLTEVYEILVTKRSLDAFQLTFFMAFTASIITLVLGVIISWVLERYEFPGRHLLDSIVDIPFAMPTAVSGIALSVLYSEKGWIGHILAEVGIQVSYTRLGILVALIFIGLPFTVRATQPAIGSLDRQMEEAAASLGATRWTIIRKIIFPQLLPSIVTGFTMSFARGLGEYGSIIFIAGNVPYVSEILPLLIVVKLEEFNYRAATVLAVGMLAASFAALVTLGALGSLIRKRYG